MIATVLFLCLNFLSLLLFTLFTNMGSKGFFYNEIGSKGEFLKFEEFFIRMIIRQKLILYTPAPET